VAFDRQSKNVDDRRFTTPPVRCKGGHRDDSTEEPPERLRG
jgi:hypothetical protein